MIRKYNNTNNAYQTHPNGQLFRKEFIFNLFSEKLER
jgi:hypothetical protein